MFVAGRIRGVSLTGSGSTQLITFTRDLAPAPCTVTTAAPFRAPGRHAFEVAMPIKQARTALGFTAQPLETYLTPSCTAGAGQPGHAAGYVSMGGAGFIYPASVASGSRYGEGDTVRCEVDFDARTVAFFVNGEAAGGAMEWVHGDSAYPAISSEGGTVKCAVRCIWSSHIQ